MKKNFKAIANGKCETNKQAVNATAKGAIQEIKSLSPLYYVNQLNKLSKRNEFVDGVNISALGKMLRQIHSEKDAFTLKVFTPDYLGRPCYIRNYKGEDVTMSDVIDGAIACDNKGNEVRISLDGSRLVVYRAVSLSLSGMIQGFRAILNDAAAAQDKEEREALKEVEKQAREKARAERAERSREFSKRVAELRKNVASGIMTADSAAEQLAALFKSVG